MNSQCEIFQKELLQNWGGDYHDFHGFASGHGKWSYSDHGVNALWIIWQAATEQGVGEAEFIGWAGFHTQLDQYVFRSGSEKPAPSRFVEWLPVYTHPPKPTGGGVPEAYVLVPLDVVDREEILDKAMDYHFDWCGYASRSDLAEAARAVAYAARDIATQQPPEQE